MADESARRSLELKTAETQFRGFLSQPRFDWLQNWARLSAMVFERLHPHGLRLADMKIEAVGSLADFPIDRVSVESFDGGSDQAR